MRRFALVTFILTGFLFLTSHEAMARKVMDIIVGGKNYCLTDENCSGPGAKCHPENHICMNCPAPQKWFGLECKCDEGKFLSADASACIECETHEDCEKSKGAYWYCNTDEKKCQECFYPKEWNDEKNTCECIAGTEPDGDTCVCSNPNTKLNDSGNCVCQISEEKCLTGDFTGESDCHCCPADKPEWTGLECTSCPAGTYYTPLLKTCVGCLTDDNCADPTTKCDPETHFCSKIICSEEKPVWNSETRTCEPCPTETPVWCKDTKKCVMCLSDIDCATDLPLCDLKTNTCVPCPMATPYWNTDKNACTACPEATPRWNETAKKCEVCPNETPYWNAAGKKCEACSGTTPFYNTKSKKCEACPNATPVWNTKTKSCQSCDEVTPYWNTQTKKCEECPVTTPVWNTQTKKCEACAENTPVWDAESKICVSCLNDTNCGQNQMCFNNSENVCTPVYNQCKSYENGTTTKINNVVWRQIKIDGITSADWYDAQKACQKHGENLPSVDELQSLSSTLSAKFGETPVHTKNEKENCSTVITDLLNGSSTTVDKSTSAMILCRKDCKSNSDCGGDTPVCNTSTGACSACQSATPKYNTSTKKCEECPTETPVWNATTKKCETCPAGTPIWNETTKKCQACPSNSTLSGKTCVCTNKCQKYNVSSNSCVDKCPAGKVCQSGSGTACAQSSDHKCVEQKSKDTLKKVVGRHNRERLFLSNYKMNFYDAINYCEAQGMHLATIQEACNKDNAGDSGHACPNVRGQFQEYHHNSSGDVWVMSTSGCNGLRVTDSCGNNHFASKDSLMYALCAENEGEKTVTYSKTTRNLLKKYAGWKTNIDEAEAIYIAQVNNFTDDEISYCSSATRNTSKNAKHKQWYEKYKTTNYDFYFSLSRGFVTTTYIADSVYGLTCLKRFRNTSESSSYCAAGYYCPGDYNTITQCPAGSFCPVNSKEPIACAETMYSPAGSDDGGDCQTCNKGYYCPTPATQKQCPAGYFCPSGSTKTQKCPAGTYSNQGAWQCTTCPAGNYCPAGSASPKKCSAGTYCPAGTDTPKDCPAGYYCPAGSGGTTKCGAGYYCPAKSSGQTKCPAGKYCPAGSSTPTTCPAGSYCPAGSGAAKKCSNGYYCPTGSSAHNKCPAGSYCPTPTQKTSCPAGSYCPAGVTAPKKCTAGYYCPANATDQTKCPAGSYCPASSSTPTTCPTGSYCPAGSGATKNCSNGYYCPTGSSAHNKCPAGSYCPTPTQKISCPAGNYCPAGVTAAKKCSAGYYCPANATGQTKCPAGKYCPAGSSTPTTCPKNHYCPAGSSTATACPSKKTSAAGASSSNQCK